MFEKITEAIGRFKEYLNNNEATIMRNWTRVLAFVAIGIALVYAIIFMRQISAFG